MCLEIGRFYPIFGVFYDLLAEGNRQIFFIICGKIRAEIVKDHFASWCNCEHASTFLVGVCCWLVDWLMVVLPKSNVLFTPEIGPPSSD